MSELARFRSAAGVTAVATPFALDALLDDWAGLRVAMTRSVPEGFERDEWAYLITFLERENLAGAFRDAFGEPADESDGPVVRLARPRGPVAVWLPNNVSLLGPLTTVLLSLTGCPLLLKGGSRSDDLTGAFLAFVREHLEPGALAGHLEAALRYEVFDRTDARNAEYAGAAAVRVFFGSDEAAGAVEALPHPLESLTFPFVDRRSEAWIEPAVLDDELCTTLLKVFAVYGQAGCTSPRRVVLLDAEAADAERLRDRLLELWPTVLRGTPAPHVASGSILARQWAAALGWDARAAPGNAAVLACGAPDLEPFGGEHSLPIVAATLDAAIAGLPENVQTIGHALESPASTRWLALLARLGAKRFVPLARMHHFGTTWDGVDFWRQCFELVEVGA